MGASIGSDGKEILLTFNTTVDFTGTWNESDWRVEIFLPNRETVPEFNYTITPPGGTAFVRINTTIENQLFGYNMEYVVLTFIDRKTTVETTYNTEMIDTQFTFYLEGNEVSGNAGTVGMWGTITFLIFLV